MAPVMTPQSLARRVAQAELDPRSSSPFDTIPRRSPAAPPPSSFLSSAAVLTPRDDNPTRLLLLAPRLDDNANIVPDTYGAPSGPDAGTVVGIVLGSVGGFLLILWLIYSITNLGNSNAAVLETASVGTASVVTRKSRKHHRRRRHSSASRTRGETVEVRRTERVVPVPMQATTTERIIVEERRGSSRAPPIPMPMPPPPRVVHDDDDDDDDDEVVVIEEHTPPRRRDKRHSSRRRDSRRSSERRPTSGYRDVDPYRYAGGDASVRSVSRRRSPSRGR